MFVLISMLGEIDFKDEMLSSSEFKGWELMFPEMDFPLP
jgi:hypothetical protein